MPPAKPTLAELLRARLIAQSNLFSTITNHPTLIGSARERALSELLRGIIPRRLEVLTGAIALVPTTSGQHELAANQVDIMVVDTMDYPVLLREGETVVALPQSVRAVIEVKSDLEKGEKFRDAMRQIGLIRRSSRDHVFATAIFSYVYPANSSTLREWLQNVLEHRSELQKIPRNDRKPNEQDTVEAYDPVNMPDLIVAEKGSVAMKEESVLIPAGGGPSPPLYKFFNVDNGGPPAIALVEQVMMRITGGGVQAQFPGGTQQSVQLAGAFSSVARFLNTGLRADPRCAPLDISE